MISSPPPAGFSGGNAPRAHYPSPWLDYASFALPTSHEEVLWWSQYLWLMDGTYRSAMERVASHFLTIVDFPDLDIEEENEWRYFFSNIFDYRSELLACAHDFLTYGNVFVSLYFPFVRIAKCPSCHYEASLSSLPSYDIELSSTEPYIRWIKSAPCPVCGSTADYHVIDRKVFDLRRVTLIRYSPHEIEMAYNRFSRSKDIYWKISEHDRRLIMTKGRIYIEETPIEVLEAVATNQYVKLDRDYVLHIAEPTLSGLQTNGWGLPRSLANFRAAWMQQIANKTDQAVMLDYIFGIRMISPASVGPTDPMMSRGMQEFVQKVSEIIDAHRRNPTSFHTVPYPLQYVFMGGEGNQMITHDKLMMRQRDFLSQMGVPLEYHQMTLQAQAAPMALRLFEMYWQCIPALYNRILDWMVEKISAAYDLPKTRVVMRRTTVVDDMQYKTLLMQLMAGQQVSPQTALEPFGINAAEEIKKVYKHQAYVSKVQQEFNEHEQKRQESAAAAKAYALPTLQDYVASMQQGQGGQGGQVGQGGAPMPPPPTGQGPGGMPMPQSLAEIAEYAEQMAQQLVTMPEYERKQALRMLRESNPELHALVIAAMDRIRRQAASQGQHMLLQGGPPGA